MTYLKYTNFQLKSCVMSRLVIADRDPQPTTGLGHLVAPVVDRHIRTERKAEDYRSHTLHTHIYTTPDTYVGSLEWYQRPEYILDVANSKLMPVNVTLPDSIIRCYLEILSNAGDNADASRRIGVDAGSISVTMDRNWVTVRSQGEPIPVVPKPELCSPTKCMTLVDFIFGQLLTSSNYDSSVIRMGCGRNGYGAKLCNIFSHVFIVKVGDPRRGQEHTSRWEGNMTRHVESKSVPGFSYGRLTDGSVGWATTPGSTPYTGPSYVEVSWQLDFQRFNCQVAPGGAYGYPDEAFGLFARYLADFGLTCKVPVSFNGTNIDVRSLRDYGALFFTKEQCASAIVHYEWGTTDNEPPELVSKLKNLAREKLLAQCPTAECIPMIEMCIFDTPDEARVLSFVNGLMTKDGGVHVDEAYKNVAREILDNINSMAGKSKRPEKKRAEKKTETKKTETKTPHLTPGDVKPHVSMIINCRLPDPIYTSQSKTQLSKPKPKFTIDEKIAVGMSKWSLTERLYAALDAKMFKTLSKTDGKKKRHVILEKGEDANEAGGPRSAECILYLVEGKSASSYPKKRIVLTPGGKDLSGYYPLKGKPLNVTDASILQISENEEINSIKKMMGFREGVDYTDPENRKQLRYGFIMCNMDADSDGKHILCLNANMLYRRWPSILRLGMFGYLMVPTVRLFNDKTVVQRFYSVREFEKWLAENPNHGFRVKYYKGLGTSTDADIKDDLTTAPMVVCIYDDTTGPILDLAFRRSQADARKLWIQRWREATKIDDIIAVPSSLFRRRTISAIINYDLVDYTIDALFRAIPSFKDGLKKSQRQGLYYILTHWNYGRSRSGSMKVAEIACAASAALKYHHGPKSMMDMIIGLAQDFVGSNNLNMLMPEGQFGTRDDGGDDASDGRYSETLPEWWIKYVYSEELTNMVPCRLVDGKEVEPVWLPCDIPVHVINGTVGVATGHSTFIPCHNPYDVIRWLLERCGGNENPTPIKPWYRGFTGTIEYKTKTKSAPITKLPSRLVIVSESKEEKSEEKEDDDRAEHGEHEEVVEGTSALSRVADGSRSKGSSMKTIGKFEIIREHKGKVDLVITELPIGKWLYDYRKWLESLLHEKKIDDFRDNSTTEVPRFTIFGFSHPKGVNHDTLHLVRSYGLSNMNLLDDDGYPYHFDTIQQVMEAYFRNMIDIYDKVIRARISKVEEELRDISYRLKFIAVVVEGKIVTLGRPKSEIHTQMDAYAIPHKYLNSVKLYDCTLEEMEECRRLLVAKETKLAELRLLTPQSVWTDKLLAFDAALKTQKYA